jgi:hypothetical protein
MCGLIMLWVKALGAVEVIPFAVFQAKLGRVTNIVNHH